MCTISNIVELSDAITHAGTFHVGDVMATVILAKVGYHRIHRCYRLPQEYPENAIVYDIGTGEFSNHQEVVKIGLHRGQYASTGLLWRRFGPQIVANTCNPEMVFELLDESLFQGIDAVDNGKMPAGTTLSSIIADFNPTWDSDADQNDAFLKAVSFAETVFDNAMAKAIATAKAQQTVEDAIQKAERHIMVLERFVPSWEEYVFASPYKKSDEIWFVVYPSNGRFVCHCVPNYLGDDGVRKSLPQNWKENDGALIAFSANVWSKTFCDPSGMFCGAETFEDTMELARQAVIAW